MRVSVSVEVEKKQKTEQQHWHPNQYASIGQAVVAIPPLTPALTALIQPQLVLTPHFDWR